MVTRAQRAEQFKTKPRKAEGYAMCMSLTDGHCTCLLQGRDRPCHALVWPLQNAWGDGAAAADIERLKMEYNRRHGTFYVAWSGELAGCRPAPTN